MSTDDKNLFIEESNAAELFFNFSDAPGWECTICEWQIDMISRPSGSGGLISRMSDHMNTHRKVWGFPATAFWESEAWHADHGLG